MAKKKVDYKKEEKMAVKGSVQELFQELGFVVNDGKDN